MFNNLLLISISIFISIIEINLVSLHISKQINMSKYIATKFRKHPLSFIKGGVSIIVTHKNGQSFLYDKVHYPLDYINGVLKKSEQFISEIYINDNHKNELMWSCNDQVIVQRRLVPISSILKAA